MNDTHIDSEASSNFLFDNAVEIYEVDTKDLDDQQRLLKHQDKKASKIQKKNFKKKSKDIKSSQKVTNVRLDKRTLEVEKILEQKDLNNKTDFTMKEKVLRSNFYQSIGSLIKSIKLQRALVQQAYGPIVLQAKRSEKPLFSITESDSNKENIKKF